MADAEMGEITINNKLITPVARLGIFDDFDTITASCSANSVIVNLATTSPLARKCVTCSVQATVGGAPVFVAVSRFECLLFPSTLWLMQRCQYRAGDSIWLGKHQAFHHSVGDRRARFRVLLWQHRGYHDHRDRRPCAVHATDPNAGCGRMCQPGLPLL